MERIILNITDDTPTFQVSEVGVPGPRGIQGLKGNPLTWDDLTAAQKASLKGEPLRYSDLTATQKADLGKPAVDAVKPYVTQVQASANFSQQQALLAEKHAKDAAASAIKAENSNTPGGVPLTPDWSVITNIPDTASRWPTFAEVTDKPLKYPAEDHQHFWADIMDPPTFATRWPTPAEVGALPTGTTAGQLGGLMAGQTTATDVGALPSTATAADIGALPTGTTPADIGALAVSAQAVDAAKLGGYAPNITVVPSTVPVRDVNGDTSVRSVKTSLQSQTVMAEGSAVAYRVNNTTDNQLRFATKSGLIDWLGTVKDATLLSGKTVDQVRAESRQGLMPDSITLNGKSLLNSPSLTAADLGLGNVANYGNTSSYAGESTTLYATQKAAYDAAFAPLLDSSRKRRVFYGTKPVIPEEGDVFITL